MSDFLNKQRSDYFITITIFILGLIPILGLFTFTLLSTNINFLTLIVSIFKFAPLFVLGIYLWGKAITEDIIRINKGIKLKMPGFIYFIYGFQWVSFYFIFDSIKSSLSLSHALHLPTNNSTLFIYNHIFIFWLIIDLLALIIFNKYFKQKFYLPHNKPESEDRQYEKLILERFSLSYISYLLASLILGVLTWF